MRLTRRPVHIATIVTLLASATMLSVPSNVSADEQTLTVTPSAGLDNNQLVEVEATGIEVSDGITDFPIPGTLQPSVHQCSADFVTPSSPDEELDFLDLVGDCIELDAPEVVNGIARSSVRVQDQLEIRVGPIRNDVDCRSETCQLVVLSGTGTVFSSSITLQYAHAIPLTFLPALRISDARIDEGTIGSVDVRLTAPIEQNLTLEYVVSADTATGGVDVVEATGSIELAAGQTDVSVPVEVLDDNDIETDESGTVTVTTAAGQPSFGSPLSATFVIADDDISVTPATGLIGGDLVDVSAGGVVGTAGIDFSFDEIEFRPGVFQCDAAVAAFDVPSAIGFTELWNWLDGIDDNCVELAGNLPVDNGIIDTQVTIESAFETSSIVGQYDIPRRIGRTVDCLVTECVLLVLAADGQIVGNREIAVETFTTAPLEFLPAITPGGVLVSEGNSGSSTWNVPVRLSRPLDELVTVEYRTVDDSEQTSVAASGSDYVAASGTVTFEPGQIEAFVEVEVLGDTSVESPLVWGEWGLVQFENPSENAVINTGPFFGAGLFIILDDDTPAA